MWLCKKPEHGKITAERKADDDNVQSFKILMKRGCTFIRNNRFLKHEVIMAIYEGSPSNMAEEDGPSNQGDDSGVDTQRASPHRKTRARRK